jgi:hypothetical protein
METSMKLAPNWREVLRYAWSIRLMLLAAVFSGLEVALPLMRDFFPIDPGVFAILAFLATAAAFVARLIAQRNAQEGAPIIDNHHEVDQ